VIGLLRTWRRDRERLEAFRDALVLLYWRRPLEAREADPDAPELNDDVLAGAALESLEVHRIVAEVLTRDERGTP